MPQPHETKRSTFADIKNIGTASGETQFPKVKPIAYPSEPSQAREVTLEVNTGKALKHVRDYFLYVLDNPQSPNLSLEAFYDYTNLITLKRSASNNRLNAEQQKKAEQRLQAKQFEVNLRRVFSGGYNQAYIQTEKIVENLDQALKSDKDKTYGHILHGHTQRVRQDLPDLLQTLTLNAKDDAEVAKKSSHARTTVKNYLKDALEKPQSPEKQAFFDYASLLSLQKTAIDKTGTEEQNSANKQFFMKQYEINLRRLYNGKYNNAFDTTERIMENWIKTMESDNKGRQRPIKQVRNDLPIGIGALIREANDEVKMKKPKPFIQLPKK